MTVDVAERLLTAEEFADRPAPPDGSREELVLGEVVVMPPPRFRHGRVQAAIAMILGTFVRAHRLGTVTTESGLITHRRPDSVRGPDVAFWSRQRVPPEVEVETYPEAPADLCVEILSPGEKYGRIQQKVTEYLARGVRLVWVVDGEGRSVTAYRPGGPMRVFAETDELDGDDVLPGFRVAASEFFN